MPSESTTADAGWSWAGPGRPCRVGRSCGLALSTVLLLPIAARAEPVRLQLKWQHQFQFAGYYAAQAQDYYAAEGLDVEILEGGADRPPVPTVLAGRADFGVGDAEVLLARLQGAPLVTCAAIFQHSPYVLLSRRDRGLRTPADLVGARVMLSDDQGAAQVRAMLAHEGIDASRVTILSQSWNLQDLIEGRIDAMSAYATVEPARLQALGVEPALLRAVDYGVDFYGDTLFTTEARIRERPDQVIAFNRASLRGWSYALDHVEEIAERIAALPGVAARGVTRDMLVREAREMRPFILPDIVEVGHMNAGRWERIANTFVEVGLAADTQRLDGIVYDPRPGLDHAQRRRLRWLALAGLAGAGVILLWNVQMRRSVRERTRELNAEAAQRRQAESELREDIRQRKRAEELLHGHRHVLERIALGAPLGDTLDALLRVVEAHAPELVSSILLLDRDGRRLVHGAAPRLSEAFRRAIDGRVIGADAGSCGAAAQRREPVIVTDIATDALWNDYREIAAAEGLRACWSTPIFDAHREVLGTFALYFREPGPPGSDHLALIDMATQTAAISIARQREEQALRESRQRLTSIYDTVGDALFLVAVAPDGFRFESVNKRFVTVTGLPADAIVGRRVDEVIPAPSLPLVLERYRQAVEQRAVVRWEETSDYPTGRLVGEVSVAPILDERGECTHLVGAVHDVTARKQAEEMLRQSQKLESVGRLAGGVAHDFNNIVGVILGYGRLMRAQLPEDHAARPRLDQVIQAADRAAALTRQLLAFSRTQVMQPRTLDLGTVVNDLRVMLGPVVGEDLEIEARSCEGIGAVRADPTQVEQIIMNLVVNARDAMPGGGTISIETANASFDDAYASTHPPATPGRFVMLSVTDSGLGMDADVQRRVFEPFFSTKPPGEGTGLGLATVYGIVKQMGGFVWVYSELGRGTCFKVYLPRLEGVVASEPEPAPIESEAPRGDETILIVEDSESLRSLIQELLADQGYRVLTVKDGEEALAAVEEADPPVDLVLTDVVMPRMGGYELVKRLRATHPRIRTVYMSGYPSGALSRQGVLAPDAILVEKPFAADVLARTIRRALDTPTAHDPGDGVV